MGMGRAHRIEALKRGRFDLLVIGGGATGLGVALDAAARGLKTALVERADFAEGTSGRSTKLIHGGVRYLEKAVRNLDRAQYALVREGLRERSTLLATAPHLVHPLSLLTPIAGALQIPYILAGLKLYDFVAGKGRLSASRFLGGREALDAFPGLKASGLAGAVRFSDGQFNDSRMCVALAQSAEALGAVCVNHARVAGFAFSGGKIAGAHVFDEAGGGEFTVEARAFVNACGPFADEVRKLEAREAPPTLTTSTGIHLSLPSRFCPEEAGLLIPKTEDGRVLFVLPWEGGVIAGTTDDPAEPAAHPPVREEEIGYVLRHLARYLDPAPTRGDVLSAWSGLRPLLKSGGATHEVVREHSITFGPAGLMTVAGGKWTSYRRMAEEAVDAAVSRFSLPAGRPCPTRSLVLAGSEGYDRGALLREAGASGFEGEGARLLVRAYGTKAPSVAALARGEGLGARLVPGHPFIEAQVVHGCREEFARKPLDVLARRTPLALLDLAAAKAALGRVVALMAGELGWDRERAGAMLADALGILNTAL